MTAQKFRLVTRSDFDGLVCAVLLKHLDLIDDIKFVHPKDMQDGSIAISTTDISTNLPMLTGCIWHLITICLKPCVMRNATIILLTQMRLQPHVWCGNTTVPTKPSRLSGMK